MQVNQLTLAELITATKTELLRTGYSLLTLKAIERVWDIFQKYVQTKGIVYFSRDVGMAFLEERYRIEEKPQLEINKNQLRAIELLDDFQVHQKIFIRRKNKKDEIAQPFKDTFYSFMDARKADGISSRTLESYTIYLRRFAQYLVEHEVTLVTQIEVPHIHGFIQSSAALYSNATVYCTSCLLRVLFRYLYDHQFITKPLALSVPKVKCSKKSKIPSAYSQEEIQRLLECVDRGSPKGKRDYAILLIAIRLGIRASDICKPTFESFKWESNTIVFQQGKTDELIVFPLLNDVGEAVIDYIKYGRPTVESDEIFLRLSAPVGRMQAPTLHSIVTFYMS